MVRNPRFAPLDGPTFQQHTRHSSPARSRARTRLLSTTALVLWVGLSCASALPILSSNQLVFLDVDHAPMGACSTITYGYKGDACGVGTETGFFPYWVQSGGGGGGVLIGLSGKSSGLQLLPFVLSTASIAGTAQYFPDTVIQRKLTPCTDEYIITGSGLSFKHYTPAWQMADLNTASLSDKKRFFLPASWMVFTIQNTNTTAEDFYFGLPVAVTQKTYGNGAYQGFALVNGPPPQQALDEASLAVQSGTCDVLSGAALKSVFNGMSQGFAFHVSVPAGQTRTLTVVVAYYRSAVLDARIGAHYYYTSLFPSIDSVIDAAFAGLADAQARCQQLATAMNNARMNPYRQFIASHTLHSYMANSACVIDPTGGVYWREVEGIFGYINTFDLTEDLAFYDSLMQPWALRNVLDTYSGALPGTGYSYQSPLYNPSGTQVSAQGFSFDHDNGQWPSSGTGPAYGALMGDEELQSWILSAGLYWSHTGDNAWLTNNATVLQTCLNSMLLRDNTNAAARDGITKNINLSEITTFDDLDISLQRPAFNGRLAVRNWAAYLGLNAMFNQIGDTADAATCESMASVTAQTIVNRWNSYSTSLGYIPALLDGSSTAAITPMVEGLAYPAAMGLTNAVDRVAGPYAQMLQALSNHVVAVLVPGKCLDANSGAWMVTSGSGFTWQSKVFLSQYVAEAILGITNNNVNGTVDQVHASVDIYGAPFQGFCDSFQGSGALQGGHHYPRGVTSALWWLNPTNNPSNLVATAAPVTPTVFSSIAGDGQVILLWQGVPLAAGYNLSRAGVPGGTYTPLTNGITGASFIDAGLTNGVTYYYILSATNQFGQSLPSVELSATPLPSTGTNLTATLSASKVTISWPAGYVGWILQSNAVDIASPSGWYDVPNSQATSQMIFPTGAPTAASQFFRLRHP